VRRGKKRNEMRKERGEENPGLRVEGDSERTLGSLDPKGYMISAWLSHVSF
jgi:hypothetical protein